MKENKFATVVCKAVRCYVQIAIESEINQIQQVRGEMAKREDQGERSEIQAGNYIVWFSKAFLRFLFSSLYRQP